MALALVKNWQGTGALLNTQAGCGHQSTHLRKAAGRWASSAWFQGASASTASREEGTTQSACGDMTRGLG
eukprot:1154028-Pelagomonas_calceolata.AAC.19